MKISFRLPTVFRSSLPAVCVMIAFCVMLPGCGKGSSDNTTTPQRPNDAGNTPVVSATDKSESRPGGTTESPQPAVVKSAEPIAPIVDREPKQTPQPEPVFRPSDTRPKHDDGTLAKLGIRKYESKRLRLYTDLDPKTAATLPGVIDGLYDALVAYFGDLPPTREKTDYQVTGYLIVDKALFDRAGLVPFDLPPFQNGRHRGYEFWMYDTESPYYRRHLLIHEATHCFMYAVRDERFPTWYMEGMAEYFGTHTEDERGRVRYGVMPHRAEMFKGYGRIELVQEDGIAGKALLLAEVVHLKPAEFVHNQAYAWSWAFCQFLDSHPRYRKPFRELRRIESTREFVRQFGKLIGDHSPQIVAEWHLFSTGLVYGYDPVRSAIDFQPGQRLTDAMPSREFTVRADRGWQSSGVFVRKGEEITIAASGRFHLAEKPKPWVCEPQGISFTYFQGRPLGELVAVVVPDRRSEAEPDVRTLPVAPIGRAGRVKAERDGTLYLRVNDTFAGLADNSGEVRVTAARTVAKP